MAENRGQGLECTYDELRRDKCLTDVEDSLFAEQGGICAYTGLRLHLRTEGHKGVGFHIEHLKPQQHCQYGQDADYINLVACWPRPNVGFEPAYGARSKRNWPSPQEGALFVSPLRPDCSSRFSFNHRGEITCAGNDVAAAETIRKIGLSHRSLVELRRLAIRGVLSPAGRALTLHNARTLLRELDADIRSLEAGRTVQLMEFAFAIHAALRREIRKLERIQGSRL